MDDPWGVGRIPYIRIWACIHVYTGLYTHVHIRVLAVYAVYPVFRPTSLDTRYLAPTAVHRRISPVFSLCTAYRANTGYPRDGRPPNPDMG